MNRRWIALPAAALLMIAGVTSATAEDGDGWIPTDRPDGAVLVGEIPGELVIAGGVEVSARAITWGAARLEIDEGPSDGPIAALTMSGRAYTPDLGQSTLALGAALDMPLPSTLWSTSNDRWAIGLGPDAFGEMDEAVLFVKPTGGAVREIALEGSVEPTRSSLALWKNTALIGNMVINLSTEEVLVLDFPCVDARGAVLADGVLLFNDECDEGTVAVDVSPGGFVPADLDSAQLVHDGEGWLLAYSRGLLVLVGYDRDLGAEVLEWGRIGEEFDSIELPDSWEVLGVRAHGERFILMAAQGHDAFAAVLEADDATGPIVAVPLRFGMLGLSGGLQSEGLATSPGASGEMAIGSLVGIDLFGRTLAWHDDGDVYALTLPVLSGGSVAMDAPAGATAGDTITVTGSGFAPWEEVAVWLNSDAELLGLGYAGADGSVSVSVTIPADMAGSHTLSLFGVESGWDAGSALAVQGLNPGLEVQTG